MKYFEKAEDLISKSDLTAAVKENLNTRAMLWRFYSLTSSNDLDKAQAAYDQVKTKVESRNNPNEEMFLSTLLGLFEIKKGDYDKALENLSKADTQDPLTLYLTAVAYSKMGDKQNSEKLYDKVTKWNVNSLNLAFVRNHAMEELKSLQTESNPVSAQ
jgi:tetratricopeptide (TPR) repeat protein